MIDLPSTAVNSVKTWEAVGFRNGVYQLHT